MLMPCLHGLKVSMSKTMKAFVAVVTGKYDKFVGALEAMSRKKPVNKEKFRAAIEWHNIKFSASNFEKLWQEVSRHGNLELDKMNTNVEKLLAAPKKQATMASKDVQKKLMKVLEEKFTHIRDAFHAFDVDNSGSVTPEELRKALAKYNFVLSDEGFAQIMDGVDLSHDGKVSFAEFNKKYGSAMTGSFKGSILAGSQWIVYSIAYFFL